MLSAFLMIMLTAGVVIANQAVATPETCKSFITALTLGSFQSRAKRPKDDVVFPLVLVGVQLLEYLDTVNALADPRLTVKNHVSCAAHSVHLFDVLRESKQD